MAPLRLSTSLDWPDFVVSTSEVDFEGNCFEVSLARGFLACSALNPGGGKSVPDVFEVEVSVPYSRRET